MMERERTDPIFHAKRVQKQHDRYHRDPKAARERMRQWRAEHPEQQKEIERRQREKDRDKINARNLAAHHADKDRRNGNRREHWTQTRQKTPWRDIVRQARQRCEKKSLSFDLTDEWIAARWTGRCEITDIPFVLSKGTRNFYSPSLDQILPSRGYTKDNARFVLWGFNAFKSTGSDEDVLLAAQAIVANKTRLQLPG